MSTRIDEDCHVRIVFFTKSWFLRVWTYQEIGCAVEATVTSGSLNIDLEYIVHFSLFWSNIGLHSWLHSLEAQGALGEIANLFIMRDNITQQSPKTSLSQLVQRTRTRLAMDWKDKIYGFVALASDTPSNLSTDIRYCV